MIRILNDQGEIRITNEDAATEAISREKLRERGYAPASDGLWMPAYLVEQHEGELLKQRTAFLGDKAPTPEEAKKFPTAEFFGMQ